MKPKLCLLVRESSPTGMTTTRSRKDSSAAAPERGAGEQGQQSQQQKVNVLHADRLTRSAPALNGEMRSVRTGRPDAAAPFHPVFLRNTGAPLFFQCAPGCFLPLFSCEWRPDSVFLCTRRGCDRLAAPYGKD